MNISVTDTIFVIVISTFTAILGESLVWALVYRTDHYKKLLAEVEKGSKKLERQKESVNETLDKQVKNKIKREEERLKANSRNMSFVKMKSMFLIGFVFSALLGMLSNTFDGRAAGRLPFNPSIFSAITHRNLPGYDYTECSFLFYYIICTMSIRQNLQKILGFSPSRAAAKQGINNPFQSIKAQ